MDATTAAKIAANQKLKAYYQGRLKLAAKWKAANDARSKKWAGWIKHFNAKIAACDRRIAALQAPATPTVMYDAVTVSNIPSSAPAVAGYTSGLFPTWPTLLKLFPRARKLAIAVNAAHDADVLDVEQGDATPAQAPAWIKRQHAVHKTSGIPIIYCSVSVVATVAHLCSSAGLKHGVDYLIWSAHYTFRLHLCSPTCGFSMPFTADATQWTDKALGRSLDQSHVAPQIWKGR